MRLPISVCRTAYRCAYAALRVWWFFRRPHTQGVKCVLTAGELVLLVRHTYGHREWDLPGGTVRRGEPAAATATREMNEELGLTVARWDHVGELRALIAYRRDRMHCLLADVSGQPITVDRCELAAVAWFSAHQLPPDMTRVTREIFANVRLEAGRR